MVETPSSPADPTGAAGPGGPVAVVRSYLAAFDERDPALIASHVADGFVNDHTAALGSGSVGRPAYAERLPGFLASMPGLHYEIDQLVAEGAQVAVFYTMSGRWHAASAPPPDSSPGSPDGVPFTVRGAMWLHVVDGLIAKRRDHWDSAVFLRQVDTEAAETLARFGLA